MFKQIVGREKGEIRGVKEVNNFNSRLHIGGRLCNAVSPSKSNVWKGHIPVPACIQTAETGAGTRTLLFHFLLSLSPGFG